MYSTLNINTKELTIFFNFFKITTLLTYVIIPFYNQTLGYIIIF